MAPSLRNRRLSLDLITEPSPPETPPLAAAPTQSTQGESRKRPLPPSTTPESSQKRLRFSQPPDPSQSSAYLAAANEDDISDITELRSEEVPCPTEFQRTNQDSRIAATSSSHRHEFDYGWVNWEMVERGYIRPISSTAGLQLDIWKHGVPLEKADMIGKSRYWLCKLCAVEDNSYGLWSALKGTHSSMNHMKTSHPAALQLVKEDANSLIYQLGLNPMISKDAKVISHLARSFDIKIFQQLLLRWLIKGYLPFSKVEEQGFKDMLYYLNPRTKYDRAIPSANTMRSWVVQELTRQRPAIIKIISSARSKIHIAFDLWTSPNKKAINGVVAHFMDEKKQFQSILIGLVPLVKSHEGVNIAESILRVVQMYGFEDNLGYFISDNATNNDTCIRAIQEHYHKKGRLFIPSWRRIRCMGHNYNLVARALLFGDDPDSVESDLSRGGNLIDDLRSWQSLGSIGRLRNVIRWINGSPQRIYRFEEAQKAMWIDRFGSGEKPQIRKLILSNATRWNSTFDIIVRALELMDVIIGFVYTEEQRKDRRLAVGVKSRLAEKSTSAAREIFQHPLTRSDWATFVTYKRLLAPLADVTLQLQGRPGSGLYCNLANALPSIEFLLTRYEKEQQAQDLEGNEMIAIAIGRAWAKVNEYYKKLDESPAYTAALILDPRLKMPYIRRQWAHRPSWIIRAEKQVEKLYDAEYRDLSSLSEGEESPVSTGGQGASTDFQIWAMRAMQGGGDSQSDDRLSVQDELAEFLREKTAVINTNPIDYWLSETIQAQWPRLSKMAVDIFTIPPMSAEPERIFSLAGILITKRRNRLQDDVIEAHECLSSWDRAGLIRIGSKRAVFDQVGDDEGDDDAAIQVFQAYQ